MSPPISVNVIYNKSNVFGLNDDINVINKILRVFQNSINHSVSKIKSFDVREPLTPSDVLIHLEIPIFSAIPWAHTNILLINPEQWQIVYDKYVHAFDALIFRDPISAEKFRDDFSKKGIAVDNIYVVPWTASLNVSDIKSSYGVNSDLGFVSFLGGSTTKFQYLKQLLPYWNENDPRLTVYTTRNDFSTELQSVNTCNNITIKCQDLDADNRERIMTLYRGHLVCSEGESFGYAAANSEVTGAFTIMNSLPVFEYMYKNNINVDVVNTDDNINNVDNVDNVDNNTMMGISWLSNNYTESDKVRYSFASPTNNVRNELDIAFQTFRNTDFNKIRRNRQEKAQLRFNTTSMILTDLLKIVYNTVKTRRPNKGHFICPPILQGQDCPPITIITPTYNRKKLINIAFHNLLITDYPKDKIEWIVIEDNEKTPHLASEQIIDFQIQVPSIKIKYIPIEGRMSIGEKRNHAIEYSTNDIILFMDDDDHYPDTSFRRRVAWLTKGVKKGIQGNCNIACCTTIALYDLIHGTSAVNVPPYDLPLSQRISEATLTFRKSAWNERKFPNVSLSEGDNWINGREEQVIEMPPQQIIVAFSHGSNQSSRRIPSADLKPACFWGFPKEYLIFIHGLVDVQIEEDKRTLQSSKHVSNKHSK